MKIIFLLLFFNTKSFFIHKNTRLPGHTSIYPIFSLAFIPLHLFFKPIVNHRASFLNFSLLSSTSLISPSSPVQTLQYIPSQQLLLAYYILNITAPACHSIHSTLQNHNSDESNNLFSIFQIVFADRENFVIIWRVGVIILCSLISISFSTTHRNSPSFS